MKNILGFPILISLVMGSVIGTGIYVLPASLAQYGSISLLAWVYTSLGAVCLALTFTRLNQRIPRTGGPYVYCKEAFGPLVGFIIACTFWGENMVSISGLAVSSIQYVGFLIPEFDANQGMYQPHWALITEIGAVWVFTGINIIGLRIAGLVQVFLTLIKVIPLLLIPLIGLAYIRAENFIPFVYGHTSHFTAISQAAALTFWAFIGLEAATVPADNTQGHRDVYRATVWGTLATSFIYIFCTFVLIWLD